MKRYSQSEAKRKLRNLIAKDNDFDYGYLLELEKQKLQNMLDYFTEHRVTEDNWRMRRTLNWAIKCLNIVLNDSLYYQGYVNLKNLYRFLPAHLGNTQSVRTMLRNEKAWFLYNSIRNTYLRTWWD